MTPAERRARRESLRAARHAKWGGPRPPWVDDVLAVLRTLAIEAVKLAAASAIQGGRARHDAAVRHVVEQAGIHSDVAERLAAGLVWEAYERLADAGEV